MKKQPPYSTPQVTLLVILRIVIGWHFLYEGLIKLFNPGWSSIGYLLDSQGLFSGMFHAMAGSPGVVAVVDFLNIWGLTAIGLGLMLGLLSRVASVAGIVVLALYYFSHPPLIGLNYAIPAEGNYFIVNKTLIELIALWVLYFFPTSGIIGLDRFFIKQENN